MQAVNYFDVIQQILDAGWRRDGEPPRTTPEDLAAGIKLLAKMAIEFVKADSPAKQSQSVTKHLNVAATSDSEPSDDRYAHMRTTNQIKTFMENKAYFFSRICDTGFPLSKLNTPAAELAFKHTLEHFYDSILSKFILSEDPTWLNEEGLNARFGPILPSLRLKEIKNACSDLKHDYIENKNNRSGYYLLWLIKQVAGCSYEIPAQDSFTESTVAGVLSEFIKESGAMTHPTKFLEILNHKKYKESSIAHHFLDQGSYVIFINFIVGQLQQTPMDVWPNKDWILLRFLESLTTEGKRSVANAIITSRDSKTATFGKHLLAALTAPSLKEAILHFYALKMQVASLNA